MEPIMVKSTWKENRYRQVDILAGLFGLGAWLSIDAMYTQLPILVENAPEGWTLPSYLSVSMQCANICSILFSVLKHYAPHTIKVLITSILLLGITSLLLMSQFYYQTAIVFNEKHSLPLLILTFCFALVGYTSSVLFIPFINKYPELHLVSYFVGEGLSGFIPSIISLIQGVGITTCVNKTINETSVVVPHFSPPLFSSQLFFILMFFLMCLSLISFFLFSKIPSCQSARLRKKSISSKGTTNIEMTDENNSELLNNPVPTSPTSALPRSQYIFFLFLQAVVSMLDISLVPSVQIYSSLPYGNFAYHLTVNLTNMANPAACFFTLVFFPRTSLRLIFVVCTLAAITVSYNISTAALSPAPPLQHQIAGVVIIVASWVLSIGLLTYVKLAVSAAFDEEGHLRQSWFSAVTKAGAAVGSIITFYLINSLHVFKKYNPCQL